MFIELSLVFNTLAVCGLAIAVIYQGRVINSQAIVIASMGEALEALLNFVEKVMKEATNE